MPTPDPVALARRRQTLLDRLAVVTGRALAAVWGRLPAYTEEQVAEFERLAAPVLAAGQQRAVDLTVAYLSRVLGEPLAVDRDVVLARAAIDIREPFIAFARSLNSGNRFEDAVVAGGHRAEGVGESGVHWASRATAEAADGHPRIVGWRRTLTAKSCSWCHTVATQRYRSAESASFGHLRCDCSVEPIFGDSDPGRVINSELVQQLAEPLPT